MGSLNDKVVALEGLTEEARSLAVEARATTSGVRWLQLVDELLSLLAGEGDSNE